MKYRDIRGTLQTGDIVLFSGTGFFSNQIKKRSHSKWSHVGIVMDLPDYDMKLLFESNKTKTIAHIESGEELRGVNLVPLKERIRLYDGEVAIRRLEIKRTYHMRLALSRFRNEVSGMPYEKDTIELIKSLYDGWGGENKEDLSSLFCSELVAEAYQRMELMPDDVPSNEFTPSDFSMEKRLFLLRGRLDIEIPVTV